MYRPRIATYLQLDLEAPAPTARTHVWHCRLGQCLPISTSGWAMWAARVDTSIYHHISGRKCPFDCLFTTVILAVPMLPAIVAWAPVLNLADLQFLSD